MSVFGSYLGRSGALLNSSGGTDERVDSGFVGADLMLAWPADQGFLLQAEMIGEAGLFDQGFDSLDDDSYNGHVTVGGHLNFAQNNLSGGLFGGVGRTFASAQISPFGDDDHSATHYFGGLEAKWHADKLSLAAQGGLLDTTSYIEQELLADAMTPRLVPWGVKLIQASYYVFDFLF